MKRRTQRVSNLIRNIVSELVRTRLSDPRIEPARVSITRVEMPEDLLTARVYVSVIGSEADQRRTLRALRHAGGHIQELLMRQIQLRHTPVLEFVNDTQFKKTIQTLQVLSQVSEEIRRKDEQRLLESPQPQAQEAQDPPEPSPP
jgi:ribosome-binding factor A